MTMGDAGEGLVDAESRLAERMDEREQERQRRRTVVLSGDPEQTRELELCRLAKTDLEHQMEVATHKVRLSQLKKSIAVLERRIAELSA
jgi:hypothetical protein